MKNLPRFLLLFLFTALASFGSVQSQNSRIAYTITTLPSTLPVTFPFNRSNGMPDLMVLNGGATNSTNSPPVTLTYNSDYTVSGGGYNSQNQMQSGNITVIAGGINTVHVGDVITIIRNVPFTQTTTFSSSGFMSPAMIETSLDKLTLEAQQLKDLFNLSLHLQFNESIPTQLLLASRESELLGFDSSGAISYSTGGSGGGGTTYTAGTGLILASNEFSVNPSQSLSSLTVTNTITGSITGNATTATRLATPRAINGVNFDGTTPITVAAAAGTLTGTALPAGITSAPGLTTVAAGTLGTMAVQNSNAVSVTGGTLNGATVTGLPTPSAGTDAATKAYVDSFASGVTVRTAVLVATTANITLSGAQTIDGVSVVATNRVLVKNQTTTSQNGIYNCAAGAWSRSTDSDTAGELLVGYTYFVQQGTTQISTSWTITTAPTTLGSDPVVFTQFSGAQTYAAGTGLALTGSTFSVLAAQPTITSLGTLTGLTVNGTVAGTGFTNYFASPPPVGTTTPNTGAFSTLGVGSYITTAQLYSTGRVAVTSAPDNQGFDLLTAGLTNRWKMYLTGTETGSNAGSNLSFLASDDAGSPLFVPLSINRSTGAVSMSAGGGLTVTGSTISTNGTQNIGMGTNWAAVANDEWVATTGAGTSIVFGINGSLVARMNLAGFNGIIGATTPAAATFTTATIGTSLTMSANANIALSGTGKITVTSVPSASTDLANKAYVDSVATGTSYVVNVKAYGAVGDGVVNDTAAINLAIAAMGSRKTLYFPSGSYLVTPGSITEFHSMSYITVKGDGMASRITSSATGAPGNFLVFHSDSDHVTVQDLCIIGSATVRGSGIGIRMYASGSVLSNLYVQGTSDFGIFVTNDASTYSENILVVNCVAAFTLGDGFHFSAVKDSTIANCLAYYTSDDGLGIGDVNFPPARIEVVGFQSFQAGTNALGGTHGAGIRIFDGALDIHITGGAIYQSCEAGLAVGRFSSTTAYNTRIVVNGLKVYQCLQTAGMYAQINFQFCNQLMVEGCYSEAPVSQGCYGFLDCNNVTVTGNTAKDAVVRAFVTDDGSTTNVAATWSNWTFSNNVCLGTPSNESYYFVPATGKTIANLLLSGNTETGQSTANYIFTNRLATAAKIVNNTSMGGKAVANGGSGTSPTTANNN